MSLLPSLGVTGAGESTGGGARGGEDPPPGRAVQVSVAATAAEAVSRPVASETVSPAAADDVLKIGEGVGSAATGILRPDGREIHRHGSGNACVRHRVDAA